MALIVTLAVNAAAPFGWVTATRGLEQPEPGVFLYDWEVLRYPEEAAARNDWGVQPVARGQVTHRFTDGAFRLVLAILQAAEPDLGGVPDGLVP